MKAFPTEHPIAGTMSHHADGMDLRDYFAANVLESLIIRQGLCTEESQAKLSYKYADAMMKAREA